MANNPDPIAAYTDCRDVLMDLPPFERLEALRTLEMDIPARIREAIEQARQAGRSWQDIADQLFTTRQGAWNRYHGRPSHSPAPKNQHPLPYDD
jgi:hypothetical protein